VSMKVLIVDLDHQFFNQARDLLESRGHHVLQEAHTDLALQRAQAWRPDVVFVNAELADVAGGVFLAELESIRPRPAVVLTSTLMRFDKAWQAWQHGGDEVLFKPLLQPSELHVAVLTARKNTLLPRRRTTTGRALVRSAA